MDTMDTTAKKILVMGGGTAGWLTALYLTKTFPQHHITLMESKPIGILGAGEGSTPHLVAFLNMLGVDLNELLKECKGTIKQGISFENWNGDGEKYFHPFAVQNEYKHFSIDNLFGYDSYDYYLKHLIHRKMPLKEHTYSSIQSYKNVVDTDNIDNSIHFDAHLLADYLKKITKVDKHIYDEIKTTAQDEHGNITKVNNVECDLVFDCTGFRRELIGKLYKSEWKSYQDCLPIKRAIPFFLPPENKPYTQAIAMKYGWVWKIPLQHRCGAGYIFDSDYITDEEAFAEAKEMFPDIEYTRTIKFDAGRFKKTWINNCIAVGLSSGFTEPLEATSIWMATEQLKLLETFIDVMFTNDEDTKKDYNEVIANNNDMVMEFLHYHYMTKRDDSPFWKEFRNKNNLPKFNVKLQQIQKGNLRWYHTTGEKLSSTFNLMSWLHVGEGLGLIKDISIKGYENLNPTVEEYGRHLPR